MLSDPLQHGSGGEVGVLDVRADDWRYVLGGSVWTELDNREAGCLREGSSMNRYVVPDRMLARAYKVLDQSLRPTNNPGLILLSAIEWLAENPIIPTDEQFRELQSEWGYSRAVFGEWQRRMFLAPEPEVPEGIVDLLASAEFGSPAARLDAQKINHRVIEAYRRGQKAGQQ